MPDDLLELHDYAQRLGVIHGLLADLPSLPPVRHEYAEAHSIAEVNHRAGDGWTVHTAGTLPSGDRWYLMQREKT